MAPALGTLEVSANEARGQTERVTVEREKCRVRNRTVELAMPWVISCRAVRGLLLLVQKSSHGSSITQSPPPPPPPPPQAAVSADGWDAELALVREARPALDVAWKAADSGVADAAGPPPEAVQSAMDAARSARAG